MKDFMATGCFRLIVSERLKCNVQVPTAGYTTVEQLNLDASRSSGIFGRSSTVQPNANHVFYLIKF